MNCNERVGGNVIQQAYRSLYKKVRGKKYFASGVKYLTLADCSWITWVTRKLWYQDPEQMRLKCFAQGHNSIHQSEELLVGFKPGISCSCGAF